MRITILVDNKGEPGLATEHGFSIWIEQQDRRILFDMGQGKAIWRNVERLDVDLSKADSLVLSHGHYDHTGGIARLLTSNPDIQVYAHPGLLSRRYSVAQDKPAREIGVPVDSANAIRNIRSERLTWVKEPLCLSPDIGLTGEIPRVTAFEDTGGAFFLDPEGRRPDLLEDDQAMWFSTARGLVVVFGCCHSGLVNSLRSITATTRIEKIFAIIGGLHLVNASEKRLEETCRELEGLDADAIIPCHCTGDGAVDFMRQSLGDVVQPGCAGAVYEF